MIIKEINIENFAGIKQKTINLSEGINLLYGENEAGKSTLQAFIKVMLFGMNSSRSKDIKQNERVKYKPFTGEMIKGEITVNVNNKDIVIRRIFGATKKDDISKIYYKDNGEEVSNVDLEEPGKSFLGISKNTYQKTLFIGQLAVAINKDKEDDLLEKITNILSSGDEGISINKALDKLMLLKKKLITTRKTGELDILKHKLLKLNEEKYEAYSLSKGNIEKEGKLLSLKEERKFTRNEIDNLEIYKKYIKKLKLQKEYEEISEYLKKSEELKQKEKFIETELTTEAGLINEDTLNDIKDENALYLRMLDILSEEENLHLRNIDILEKKKSENYSFIELENIYGDFSNKIKLSVERLAGLKKSLERYRGIKYKISNLNKKIEERRAFIGDAYKLKENDKEIRELLAAYEYKLKELQHNASKYSANDRSKRALVKLKKQKEVHQKLFFIIIVIAIILIVLSKGSVIAIVPSALAIGVLGYLYVKDTVELKSRESSIGVRSYINEIQDEIKNIEDKLLRFKDRLNVKTYEGFIQKLKIFDEYITFEEKTLAQIEELELMSSYEDYSTIEAEEAQIERFIDEGIKILGVNSIDELILKIEGFNEVKEELIALEIQLEKDKQSIARVKEELKIREVRIREKLSLIGLKDINIEDLEDNLQKIKEKIIQKRDIQKTLSSIEETYKVLTKDKDVSFIEEDLKGFISKEIKYSYETQEEIDDEIKRLSNSLIDVEKHIKDIENEIKNRFIGKREISVIEEEIQNSKDEIYNKEKLLKSSMIAYEVLESSKNETRGTFGKKLNLKIIDKFKKFTNNKYNETFLSETYEVMVKDEKEIFTAELLSNGANDQLYLALRLAFIDILFEDKDISIMLDDAFVQYDDVRLKKVLEEIINMDYRQIIIFTCQKREELILKDKLIGFNYISLNK